MLGNLKHQSGFATLHLKGVKDRRKIIFKLYVYNGTNDRRDPPLEAAASSSLGCRSRPILSCIE